jgi:hypothetical protein
MSYFQHNNFGELTRQIYSSFKLLIPGRFIDVHGFEELDMG